MPSVFLLIFMIAFLIVFALVGWIDVKLHHERLEHGSGEAEPVPPPNDAPWDVRLEYFNERLQKSQRDLEWLSSDESKRCTRIYGYNLYTWLRAKFKGECWP